MPEKQTKGGKKNRKHGRNSRSPAQARYKGERRSMVNKARRMCRTLRQQPDNAELRQRIDTLCREDTLFSRVAEKALSG